MVFLSFSSLFCCMSLNKNARVYIFKLSSPNLSKLDKTVDIARYNVNEFVGLVIDKLLFFWKKNISFSPSFLEPCLYSLPYAVILPFLFFFGLITLHVLIVSLNFQFGLCSLKICNQFLIVYKFFQLGLSRYKKNRIFIEYFISISLFTLMARQNLKLGT